MNTLPDSNGPTRRASLRKMQDDLMPLQSDFEKTPIFRLSLLVAACVIGWSLFAPAPDAPLAPSAVHATV